MFVYDQFGGDGWVTAERYPAMEADNFAGQSRAPLDAEALEAELSAYHPEMGMVNRELAITHHGARAHANQLCALLITATAGDGAPAPAGGSGAPLRELSRLIRLQWLTELRALTFQEVSRLAQESAQQAAADAESMRVELRRLEELAREHEALVAAYRRLEDHTSHLTDELGRARALAATRRVKIALQLGAVFDRVSHLRSS